MSGFFILSFVYCVAILSTIYCFCSVVLYTSVSGCLSTCRDWDVGIINQLNCQVTEIFLLFLYLIASDVEQMSSYSLVVQTFVAKCLVFTSSVLRNVYFFNYYLFTIF